MPSALTTYGSIDSLTQNPPKVKGNPQFPLTEASQRDIAPVGRYTGLAFEEEVAPTTEDTEGERIARVLTQDPTHVGKDKS